MRKVIFEGAATALITPFRHDSYIDYKALEELIEFQIKGNIQALVVAGTTGEAATLTDEEHYDLIKYTVETVAGRVPVIAGAGSNSTDHARRLSRNSKRAGADGLLIVSPYYNKANLQGLVGHYKVCSEAADNELPVIVYNVPSRTGLNIKPEYYEKLMKIENIVAIKEASGDVAQAMKLVADYGNDISVYSGNDNLTLPILSVGGRGVISVAANIIPREMQQIWESFENGKIKESRNMMFHYLELIDSMFVDVNPVPVKEAAAIMGFGTGKMRLPLGELDEDKRQKLVYVMKKYHIS